MKLCDTCIYRNNVEQLKPCIIYRNDCEYYESENKELSKCGNCKYCGELLKDNLHSCNNDKSIFKACLKTATGCKEFEPQESEVEDG